MRKFLAGLKAFGPLIKKEFVRSRDLKKASLEGIVSEVNVIFNLSPGIYGMIKTLDASRGTLGTIINCRKQSFAKKETGRCEIMNI